MQYFPRGQYLKSQSIEREKMHRKFKAILILISLAASRAALASDNGQSAGLTLTQLGSVRAAALGNAFTAMTDDSGAIAFNPASLGTLHSAESQFFYERGAIDDTFGQLTTGIPTNTGGIGAQIGYYNSGTIDANDGSGEATHSVNAQRDLALSLGAAHNIGQASMGIAVKYLSSQLVEKYKASAIAGDAGLSIPMSSSLRLGAAVQNLGSGVTYIDHTTALPRLARLGLALNHSARIFSSTLLLDGVYHWNEKSFEPALGLELRRDFLALRAGYEGGRAPGGVSLGAGVRAGAFSIDYAISLFSNLDAQHRIGVSLRFGGLSTKEDKQTEGSRS
jgi:hypothetical protein